MAVTRADLFSSPDHYLHSFEDDAAVFVPMDRAAYHRSIFLDARISAAAPGSMHVTVRELVPNGPPARTGWIFHLAHGGSTLLARALDDPAGNLVLREPRGLRDVALAPDPARLVLIKAMLARRYLDDAPTVVKANVPVNFLLPQLLPGSADTRAVFLYTRLHDYLLAILRTPEHRTWLVRVTDLLAAHLGDLTGFTDAERAAALWLGQMRMFATAMARNPATASLDSEHFFAAPQEALAGAAAQLEVAMGDAKIHDVANGPLFARHAKLPGQPFDNAARLARRATLERELAPELASADRWVSDAGAVPELPRPLLPDQRE